MSSLKLPQQVKRDVIPFRAGAKRSVMRLNALGFDPIGELVDKYRKLELELARQEQIRDGVLVELRQDGQPRAYRAEVHHNIFNMLITVADKLLRYGYGRVPETNVLEERRPQPLVVQLTQEGETFVMGNDAIEELDYDEE
jgi:hypothetical protein